MQYAGVHAGSEVHFVAAARNGDIVRRALRYLQYSHNARHMPQ
jgi:hypothetical protein